MVVSIKAKSMNRTLNNSEANNYGNEHIDVAMSVKAAAYQTARAYEGGAKQLGADLGLNPSTFSHKVKPSNKDNILGLEEAVEMQILSGDIRITHAMCAAVSCICLPITSNGSGSSLAHVSKMISKFSQSITEMQMAAADGVVTQNEMDKCEKEVADLYAATNNALKSLRSMMPRRD